MPWQTTSLSGVIIFQPEVFYDARGFFYSAYQESWLAAALQHRVHFVQDNISESKKNVVRGLHYQVNPHAQGKWIQILHGEVFDVVVDLRKNSATCGQYLCQNLSSQNKTQLWIPAGFAHGFLTLSQQALLLYKTTHPWVPQAERRILWNDPQLQISWPVQHQKVILSPQDANALAFADAELF